MATATGDCIDELIKNGVIAFVPSGNSMWPTLKNRGQSVIVRKKTEKLKAMDVALYRRDNGTNVLHRVMKATSYGYIMCGDSQFTLEKVKEDHVYGVMTAFYKGKRCIEVTDPYYIAQIKRLYSNERRRKFRVKMFFLANRIKHLPARVLYKIFRTIFRKKTEGQGENNG